MAAIRGHCREVLAQGIQVHFSDAAVPRSVPPEVQLCLFRIVQEGLSNVVKHSGAPEAHVQLSGASDALMLTIADFGRGFNVGAVASRDGLGLESMRERLRLIGGELSIGPRPVKAPGSSRASAPNLAEPVSRFGTRRVGFSQP